MSRAPAFRAVLEVPGVSRDLWNDPGNVLAFDNLLDAFGAKRDEVTGSLAPSEICAGLIAKWEGMAKKLPDGRFKAYPDPATGGAPWTIGVGTTGPDVGPDTIWTRDKCLDRFHADLAKFASGVAKAIGDAPTTQANFDAMTSLAYNIGLGAFGDSTLLKKHKAGDFTGAAAQFDKWIRADGKPMQGLRARRWDERRLYEGKV